MISYDNIVPLYTSNPPYLSACDKGWPTLHCSGVHDRTRSALTTVAPGHGAKGGGPPDGALNPTRHLPPGGPESFIVTACLHTSPDW
jgi:hypothetical protein